jgi:cation:H+ antiporter
VFGSNLFNLMLVMTSAGAISPMALNSEVFSRDFASMALMTILMIALAALALHKNPQKARISRTLGLILLAGYGFYYVLLWPAITAA